jgi:hypothetical protein
VLSFKLISSRAKLFLMSYRSTFKIFYDDGANYYTERQNAIRKKVESEAEEYLMGADPELYAAHLLEGFRLEPLELKFDEIQASEKEEEREVTRGPEYFSRRGTVKGTLVTFHIPFTGTEELLRQKPNPFRMWTTEVFTDSGEVCFEVFSYGGDGGQVKREADHIIENIKEQLKNVASQVSNFNTDLPHKVKAEIQRRKDFFSQKGGVMKALGVPIRKRDGVPQTFKVPFPPKKTVIAPRPQPGPYKQDHAMEQAVYDGILKTIWDFGRQLERTPSVYEGKSEQDLRDHLLLILEAQYEKMSSTGETFNKGGKTDILVRFEKSNVFVAELAYWDGPKTLTDKIGQLLNYLTWRDSKAAVVLFVTRKDFAAVLREVQATVPKHRNFLRAGAASGESWFRYVVHIASDRHREAQLSVLAFHLPAREAQGLS